MTERSEHADGSRAPGAVPEGDGPASVDDAPARAHVLASGRVQGVWFRSSTKERASGLGVAGWVRNRPDGRVEAVFEGERSSVQRLVEWMHDGPPRASVDDVEVEYEEPRGESGFSVT